MADALQALADRGILEPRKRQVAEVKHLWSVAVRDLAEASAEEGKTARGLQQRFELAFQAAVKMCLVVMYAEGFRPARGAGMHSRVVSVLPCVFGPMHAASAEYLDTISRRRSQPGGLNRLKPGEVDDLVAFAKRLATLTLEWLEENHADIVEGGVVE